MSDIVFEGSVLISYSIITLICGLLYIVRDLRLRQGSNRFLLLGLLNYFLIQLPIYSKIIAIVSTILGMKIGTRMYLLIGFSFLPVSLLIWTYFFLQFFGKKYGKILFSSLGLVGIFEFVFWYCFLFDVSLLAFPGFSIYWIYGPVLILLLLSYLSYYLSTGIFFISEKVPPSYLRDKENTDIFITAHLIVILNALMIGNYFLLIFPLPENTAMDLILALPPLITLAVGYLTFHSIRNSISKGTYKGWSRKTDFNMEKEKSEEEKKKREEKHKKEMRIWWFLLISILIAVFTVAII